MEKLTRYGIDCTSGDDDYSAYAYRYACPDGDYVLYDDIEQLLKDYKELKFRMDGLEK